MNVTAVDAGVTQPVTATAAVVIAQDGTASVSAIAADPPAPGDLDLTTLAPGAAVPVAALAARIDQTQEVLIQIRPPDQAKAGGTPCESLAYLMELARTSGDDQPRGSGSSTDPSTGSGTDVVGPRRYRAGLRGVSTSIDGWCGWTTPLLLVDPELAAADLIALLQALPAAQLGVTTDGGAHARTLAVLFTYDVGNQPPGENVLEIGFTIAPDGVKGAGLRGVRADDTLWTWTGSIDQLGDAYHQGLARPALHDATYVRIHVDPRLEAGVLIEAIATLIAAGASGVSLGDAIDFAEP